MCGKYGGPAALEVYAGYLTVDPLFQRIGSEENMLTGKKVELLARNSQGLHVVKEMEWGLIPSRFSAAPELCDKRLFHARLETAPQLESFRDLWRRKWRCLFPMESFQQKVKAGSTLFGPAVQNAKLAIRRADGLPLGVAGIYNAIQTDTGLLLTAAMLTRDPGPRMAQIHDREPVVVEPKDFGAWLDGADLAVLKAPWADDGFTYRIAG
ncbi:MAG: hypothetical protein B7Z23_10415 [Pseudomonadales bacterium 32-61-5]|nr:MAG: hypothetical protein B7Z23_10415 [Pseudomonadales bacterium 32-61-5]